MHFAVVRTENRDNFPKELAMEDILNPTPYLNLELKSEKDTQKPQLLKCGQP